jgi:hypothetical protein
MQWGKLMRTVLLTGAGFSANWGGRLAREVNTAVARRVGNDPNLAALLHRNPNFEEALAELQNAAAISTPGAHDQLQRLETGITEVFDNMNCHLSAAKFSFRAETGWTVAEFLVLFDAIFTLNQDLLLESHHLMPAGIGFALALVSGSRWDIGVLPGVDAIPDPNVVGGYNVLRTRWRPVASPSSTVIGPRHQPYYKLHGSMNWHDPNGGRLLVMGGNRPTTMKQHSILTWYAEKFAEAVSTPNVRLMVIGYGFRDNHINRMIYEGWQKGGRTLSMFIVHPDGREILKKVNPTFGKGLYIPEPLEEITVYDSIRPLRSTFDGDTGEHAMLVDYASGL